MTRGYSPHRTHRRSPTKAHSPTNKRRILERMSPTKIRTLSHSTHNGGGLTCDTSDATRASISLKLRHGKFENADDRSITATVNHWLKCNCDVSAFLSTYPGTYPKDAIQFRDTKGNVQQVLHLLNQTNAASAASAASPAYAASPASQVRQAQDPRFDRASAVSIRSAPNPPSAPLEYDEDWRDHKGWGNAARDLEIETLRAKLHELTRPRT